MVLWRVSDGERERQPVVTPSAHLDDPNRADTFHGKVCFRTLGRYG